MDSVACFTADDFKVPVYGRLEEPGYVSVWLRFAGHWGVEAHRFKMAWLACPLSMSSCGTGLLIV